MSTNTRPFAYNYVSPGVINIKDATGSTTQIRFTSTGQLQSIQDPLNRLTQFSYDANDYLSQITAPGNSIFKFSYDAQGRLLSQTDPLNQKVSFTYTGNLDAPTTVTDNKGQVTQYSYNTYGELTGITHANGTSQTFSYDLSGNVVQAKERSGDTFQYTYDSQGKLTRKTFDDGTFESYTYNANGKISAITKGSSTISFGYDTENRLTKVTYPNGRWLQYTYDTTGRRTKMVDQSGFTVNYNYDSENRLTGLTNASGGSLITYTYDAVGRLSRETNGNGTYTTYTYDAADQLTDISNYTANGTVNSYQRYAYNNLGRKTSVTTAEGKTTYEYDASGQLTRAFLDYTNASLTDQDLRYVYDGAGNRISSTVNGVTTNYTANNLNQYTQVGSATYTYDADGNLIKVVDGTQTWTYVYNDENRLISGTTPQGTFTYEYDALGNRTAVVQNGQRTEYLVDPLGWGHVIGEYNGSGGLIANYTHGIGLVGRFGTGGTAHYYDFDAIGSTVGLTGANGSYVNRYSYRPFGETLTATEGVANPFEYVGQWGVMNDGNGLDYMRARYYSPSLGRFMNPDPLGQAGGWNIYAYSLNNPITFIDPEGTLPIIPALLATPLGRAFVSAVVGGIGGGFAGGIDYLYEVTNRGRKFCWEELRNKIIGGAIGGTLTGGITAAFPAGQGIPIVPRIGAIAIGITGGVVIGKDLGDRPGNCNAPSPAPSAPSSAWGDAKKTVSPLVFDLDNDGIELISLQNSTTFFDLDADGFAERTGWVKADDGILAWDKNGDGEINDITELFGNATTDGFIILKQLDSNNDGIIDSKDTQFNNLRVWRDTNQDAFSDVGELRSLNDWGIKNINLNYQAVDLTNEGNRISSTSTYTLANGTTRQIVDVWFALDQVTSYYNKDYQLKAETLFLPTLRGYGNLPDLYIAMSKDSTLLGMMRNLVSLDTSNFEQFYNQFITQAEALIYRWAGVQNIATNSRGTYVDGKKLAFLETFFGDNFYQVGGGSLGGPTPADPGPQASNILLGIWNQLLREFSGRLLVQGSLRHLFPDTIYNLDNDSLENTSDLNTVLNSLVSNAPTDQDQAIIYWNLVISGLDAYENRFGLSQTDYDQRINQALASSQLSGYLNTLRQPNFLTIADDVVGGTSGNDIINGGLGNDRINSGLGDDVINGGAGDDNLDGGFGNDRVSGNDGNDTIRGGLGIDTLDGGNGTDSLYLDLSNQTVNLTITNPNNGITLPGIVTATNFEKFTITTGSGNDQLLQSAVVGGVVYRSNDIFNGGAGNDTINPGLGLNDQVSGGAGDDLLVLDYSIDDVGKGIALNSYTGSEGSSGSAGRTSTTGTWIDSISFSGINRLQVTGTTKNDSLEGGAGNDTILGSAGDDSINGGGGNDSLDGGAGSDRLILNLSTQTSNLNLALSNNLTVVGVTAKNFEQFTITTGSGNDSITQPTIVNSAIYRSNDSFTTGAGNDTINAGLGSDTVNGGVGDDLLILDYSIDDVGKEMRLNTNSSNGESSGSAYRYQATTNTYLDYLSFSGINRLQVTGTTKNDSLEGGAGNDTILGSAGDDSINGGGGNDSLDGGAGSDRLILNLSTQTSNLNLALSNNLTVVGVTAKNFEQFTITTGSGNDSITQPTIVNSAIYRSNDSFTTGAGNDTINAGLGSDTVNGGVGDDLLILDYSIDDVGKEMRLNTNSSNGESSGSAYRYQATTNTYLDYLSFSGINRLQVTGTTKNDSLEGGIGNDTILGGAGDDSISSGGGNDSLDGGAGSDRLILNLSTQTSNLNLSLSNNLTVAGVTAKNFEHFTITTGSGNDSITQPSLVNGIAYRSNDSFTTGAGNDTINAGLGSDTVNGGVGDDLLILDYSIDDVGKEMRLNTNSSNGESYGSAYRDQAANNNDLDYISFSGINRLQVTGTTKNDSLEGGAGNDTILGSAGDDSINGGGGNDSLDGGAGSDRLILNLSTQTSNLNLSLSNNLTVAGVTAKNFEHFTITTGSGNDSITQPSLVNGIAYRSNDSFTTGAGNDTINAGLGSDTVNGGVGDDLLILDYSIDDVGKEMRLNTNSSNGESYGSAYRDQVANNNDLDYISFSGINRLQVTGTTKNDSLEGGAGNDTILGGAGDDSINGGGGNDSLDGGAGNDILIGGLGNDTLIGGNGTDRFSFNNGNQGIDIIIDFLSNQSDKISVSASGFGGGLVAGGTITADQFVIGTAAGDASDRFIYNSVNGDLLFDIDGTGALAATQIAVLSSKPSLAYTDIVVIA
ncbi:hypothetical protein HCG51_30950 [Tolypothrix sp. PCC 7910]|uniref:RHS repeat-associated core domain-containing protein n=1 Tax=Tolypothrix sp. PCC 7910 TaxID=2099387 RepID=UPI00142774D0|nr:RHS repeat-associated core domain-containing protein [Tolypothrix sp. PCC 7910]QIR40677.1 hypothetical protein HCG51_30950 [Tolypothrix sp. PCC 7910]